MADKVPYFNAPIYLQNKSVIGKVDEILGPINEVFFSIKMDAGMVASSFKKGDKVYIGGDKLLPIERFLPKPKVAGGVTSMSISSRILDIANQPFQNEVVGAEVVHQGVGVVDLGDVVHLVVDLLREGEPEGEVGEALALEVVVTAEDVAVAEGLGAEVEDLGADRGEEVGAREVL
ncbi:hypothetical protein HWV62_17660 [Athelia sp. TMB]|nr:hypothetical protein HWV62_17660 [Athelia sp. TMB]